MTAPVAVFTEFYVQTTGNNLNAGSTTSDTALATYVSSLVAGWNSGTGVFEVASGNPVSDGVTVGMFASVYVTSGATVATFVARITAVTSTQITVSLTADSGTPPSTDVLGLTTMKVGGAWKGPNGATGFPYNFVSWAMTDASNHSVRVNYKNGTNYGITAAMTHAVTGTNVAATTFEGYTATPGDGGIATIDGGSPAGSTYTMLTVSVNRINIIGFKFQNNGTGTPSGSTGDGIRLSGGGCLVKNCIATGIRRSGFYTSGNNQIEQCEAYDCQKSNNASGGVFGAFTISSSAATMTRCIAHNNTAGSNAHGIAHASTGTIKDCIVANNTGSGLYNTATGVLLIKNCDFYNNTLDGINFASGPATPVQATIEGCNFVKNGAYGIRFRASMFGIMQNNNFGSGSQANASGNVLAPQPCSFEERNTGIYDSGLTPWTDPANGDFRINMRFAKGGGPGRFTITKSGVGPTVGYPDVGAAQASHS